MEDEQVEVGNNGKPVEEVQPKRQRDLHIPHCEKCGTELRVVSKTWVNTTTGLTENEVGYACTTCQEELPIGT